MEDILILALALLWDITLGEPPRWLHPVVGLGKIIALEIRGASFSSKPLLQFLYGMAAVLVTLSLFTIACYLLLAYLKGLSLAAYIIAGVYLLKSSFSLKELARAALRVKGHLERDDLARARTDIKALVGRDTSTLDKPLLVSAAVESVAENTSDSFVAPLFYFIFLGVPGAAAYRIANTFDSMTGYRGKYEYLGKFAARLDDLLSYVPSRIAGLLTVLAAFFKGRRVRKAWQVMSRDHARTRSPNAGWPMSAAAGALQVQLIKPGHYRLGDENKSLNTGMIGSGVGLMQAAAFTWILLTIVLIAVRHVFIS